MSSCDLLYDEGDWVSEDRYPEDYQEIVINGVANVFYHYSDTPRIEVSYYARHISDVKTSFSKGQITIDNSFNGQWYTDLRLPEIHLYTKSLAYVDIKEAAGFFCEDTLHANNFEFFMHGDVFEASLLLNVEIFKLDVYNSAGIAEAKGSCEQLNISNKGQTQIDAVDLHTKGATITQQSSLDVTVRVTDVLSYRIIRNGNIIVRGNPALNGEILGDGELIVIEDEK